MSTFQQNLENGVRSTALRIHRGMPNDAILFSSGHQLQAVHIVADTVLGQPLHKYPIDFAFVDVERTRLGHILQQIVYLFIVDLQERTEYLELGLGRRSSIIDSLEEGVYRPRSNPSIVLIRFQLFVECLLMRSFGVVRYEIFPIVAEHCIGLACVTPVLPEPVCP